VHAKVHIADPILRNAAWRPALAFVGGYLLWADFIAPRLGISTWED
jgi:hypothetical protein